MSTYTPTIITQSTPGIQATMAGVLSYDEFINSLGQYVYSIDRFILEARSIDQLLQPINFTTNDATGTAYGSPIIMNPDPYQFNSAIHEDISGQPILLNGQSALTLNLLAGSTMTFIMNANQIGPIDAFAELGEKPNTDRIEDSIGNLALYDQFDLFLR